MLDARDAAALAHLKVLARTPRPAGSEQEEAARRYCRARFEASGFSVVEEPFEYSAAVGRWATPLAGLALGAVLFAIARGLPIGWLAALLVTLGIVGRWATIRGVLDFPIDRRKGVNLTAVRGTPVIWLVAHLDSKSQPIPIVVRAGSIVLLAAACLVVLVLGALGLLGREIPGWMAWVAIVGGAAGMVVALSWVGGRSPGAADNATGVATVLRVAETLQSDVALGVAITTAEELGMAGARAWIRDRTNARGGRGGDLESRAGHARAAPPGGPPLREDKPARPRPSHLSIAAPIIAAPLAINIDLIDDDGSFRCMAHGRRSHLLAVRIVRAGQAISRPIVVRSLLPGILTDGVALADAGWRAVTLSRGTLDTLWRIHTPRDSVDRLTGRGVVAAAQVVREFVERAEP